MMKMLYKLSFALGMTNWDVDETPVEVMETLKGFALGTAFDIGCGEGKHSIEIAKKGWRVVGLDYVPKALRCGKAQAEDAGVSGSVDFRLADITRLDELDLPMADFVLDLGCFHLLKAKERTGYIDGLTPLIQPGGILLIHAFTPRQRGSKKTGFSREEMESFFAERFSLEKISDRSVWRYPANWYWFRRQA
ncbi:MAG: class I SAM-dependent methyltransferase [Anaerolineaceae bacterium]|nr:class I SAM-dependent methyltransferase [Anaerolineaceae bacterium]